MKKRWRVVKHYICEITGENCGDKICGNYRDSDAPDCDDCDTRIEAEAKQ